jgi:GAF domain-containing protein
MIEGGPEMAVDRSAFKQALHALCAFNAATDDIAQALRRIVETAQSLPGADHVHLTLLDGDGRLGWIGGTSPAERHLVQLQRDLGQGPSVTAVATDEIVASADAPADPRWPALSLTLRDQRIGATLSVPIRLRGHPVGTLDLVAERPREFASTEIDATGTLADVIAEYLEAAAQAEERAGQVDRLQQALTSRILIEQAKGVLMERTGLTSPEVFQQLRAAARGSRRKVVEVARTVLASCHQGGHSADDAVLERMTRAALARLPLTELLDELVTPVRALVDADVVALLLRAERGEMLEGRAAAGLPPGMIEQVRVPIGTGMGGWIVATHAPLLIADLNTSKLEAPAFSGLAVRSAAGVPLMFGEQAVGALLVGRYQMWPFSTAQRERLQRAADRIGPAVLGARLDEIGARTRADLRQSADRLRRLQSVTAALSSALTPAEVTQVVKEGVAVLNATGGVVCALTGDGQIELTAAVGYDQAVLDQWSRFPLSSPVPLAEAARERHPIWIRSRQEYDERYPSTKGAMAAQGHHSLAAVPLIANDTVLGLLGLSFGEPQPFAEEDRLFILTLADQGAQALERARLYLAVRQERDTAVAAQHRLAFLAEASAMLAASVDPRSTLDQIAWLTVPKLADICMILLAEDGVLRPAAVAYRDPAVAEPLDQILTDYPAPIDAGGRFGGVLQTGQARLISEIDDQDLVESAQDATHLRLLRQLGTTSSVVVPMAGRSDRLGLVVFLRRQGSAPYTATDLSLVQDLVARAGIALDNARRLQGLARPSEQP